MKGVGPASGLERPSTEVVGGGRSEVRRVEAWDFASFSYTSYSENYTIFCVSGFYNYCFYVCYMGQ